PTPTPARSPTAVRPTQRPGPASALGPGPRTDAGTYLNVVSGDLVEVSTDRSLPPGSTPTPSGGTSGVYASTPAPPRASLSDPSLSDPFNEQPTRIYREESRAPRLLVIGGNDRGQEFPITAAR